METVAFVLDRHLSSSRALSDVMMLMCASFLVGRVKRE